MRVGLASHAPVTFDVAAQACDRYMGGARRGHLVELLVTAGLRDVVAADLSARRSLESFDRWWEPFTRGVGPGGTHVAGLAPEQRAELRERCRSMLPAGTFVIEAHAWAACGSV